MPVQRAIFLDRDNTIIHADNEIGDADKVRLIQGAANAIASLRGLGFRIIVVTNQPGVAKGKFTEQDVDKVHQKVAQLMLKKATGAIIDRFYYCPFHPEATLKKYRGNHPWFKPNPGMLTQAANDIGLDIDMSWMIGDSMDDITAGEMAGVRTILLGAREDVPRDAEIQPDFFARNLIEAARIIAQHPRREKKTPPAPSMAKRDLEKKPKRVSPARPISRVTTRPVTSGKPAPKAPVKVEISEAKESELAPTAAADQSSVKQEKVEIHVKVSEPAGKPEPVPAGPSDATAVQGQMTQESVTARSGESSPELGTGPGDGGGLFDPPVDNTTDSLVTANPESVTVTKGDPLPPAPVEVNDGFLPDEDSDEVDTQIVSFDDETEASDRTKMLGDDLTDSGDSDSRFIPNQDDMASTTQELGALTKADDTIIHHGADLTANEAVEKDLETHAPAAKAKVERKEATKAKVLRKAPAKPSSMNTPGAVKPRQSTPAKPQRVARPGENPFKSKSDTSAAMEIDHSGLMRKSEIIQQGVNEVQNESLVASQSMVPTTPTIGMPKAKMRPGGPVINREESPSPVADETTFETAVPAAESSAPVTVSMDPALEKLLRSMQSDIRQTRKAQDDLQKAIAILAETHHLDQPTQEVKAPERVSELNKFVALAMTLLAILLLGVGFLKGGESVMVFMQWGLSAIVLEMAAAMLILINPSFGSKEEDKSEE